jgi:uncharacterized Fe-S cluster-containing radical SAM superfamily protein
MTEAASATIDLLDPRKFRDPERTAGGERRASVALKALATLWFNTGTLCNLTCRNCYIESSPTNDRLVYLRAAEVAGYLDEIAALGLSTREIGFTGGEPFLNPEILAMVEAVLERGLQALVLTNAMRPMMKCAEALVVLKDRFGERLVIRVSVDHYTPTLHEVERGQRSWQPMIKGLAWLAAEGFNLRIAGRNCWGEPEAETRKGYARLFAKLGLPVDAQDPEALVIFPEMDAELDVPEITESCWDLLGVCPESVMCATSRMVVKRKGEDHPVVVPCTLLPDGDDFVMGKTLAEAAGRVNLNHPHCARFCVLGGGSCSKITDRP